MRIFLGDTTTREALQGLVGVGLVWRRRRKTTVIGQTKEGGSIVEVVKQFS
jgi:DNA-binding FadR family transcriptional regulator